MQTIIRDLMLYIALGIWTGVGIILAWAVPTITVMARSIARSMIALEVSAQWRDHRPPPPSSGADE